MHAGIGLKATDHRRCYSRNHWSRARKDIRERIQLITTICQTYLAYLNSSYVRREVANDVPRYIYYEPPSSIWP